MTIPGVSLRRSTITSMACLARTMTAPSSTPTTRADSSIPSPRGQAGVDQSTQYVHGVTRGTGSTDSRITSNDLVKQINYPDPTTGQPSSSASQEEFFAYNAQGETIWQKNQQATE